MGMVFTLVKKSATYEAYDVTSLDADTSGTQAHALGAAPCCLNLTPLVSVATYPAWGMSADGTTITVVKGNVVGSGGTTPGTTKVVRVEINLPHSIITS